MQPLKNDNQQNKNEFSKDTAAFFRKHKRTFIVAVLFLLAASVSVMEHRRQLNIEEKEREQRKEQEHRIKQYLDERNKQYNDYIATLTEIVNKEQKNGFEQKFGKIISLDINLKNFDRIKNGSPTDDLFYAPPGVDIVVTYRTDKFTSTRPYIKKPNSDKSFDNIQAASRFATTIIQNIINNLMSNNIDPQIRKINITTSIKAIVSEKTVTGKDIIKHVATYQYDPYRDRITYK